jgi:hypothetical protein
VHTPSTRPPAPARAVTRYFRILCVAVVAVASLVLSGGNATAAPGPTDIDPNNLPSYLYYKQIHTHLDSSQGIGGQGRFALKCEGFSNEGSAGTCWGRFTDGHLAPFDTTAGNGYFNWDDGYISLRNQDNQSHYDRPDARISGDILGRNKREVYPTYQAALANSNADTLLTDRAYYSGTPGAKGGPLSLNVSARGDGYDFYLDGWVLFMKPDTATQPFPFPSGMFGSN